MDYAARMSQLRKSSRTPSQSPKPLTISRLQDSTSLGREASTTPTETQLRHFSLILLHLFGGKLRFSDLERAIPAISQKMLIQQLRQLERDGIVARILTMRGHSKMVFRPRARRRARSHHLRRFS